jgi:hypothetical protein
MEGPYMNGTGGNRKSIRWLGDIKREDYAPLVEALVGVAKIYAIDPARPGIVEFMKDVKAADPNACSDAVYGKGQAAENTAAIQMMGNEKQMHLLCAYGWKQGVLHIANRELAAPFAMKATLTPTAEGLELDMTGIGYPTEKSILKRQE